MSRVARRISIFAAPAVLALALSGCGGPFSDPEESPTPDIGLTDPGQSDPVADITSYQVSGGDGKYQFTGVLCSVDGGEVPADAAGVTGGANMAPSIGVFSWNWLYGEDEIDSATGEITDLQVTPDSIHITATYRGYASIGDGGTNTGISGEMTFDGVRTETPASCLE
jgi:hypothetical protein